MSETETAAASKKTINVAIIEDRRELREGLSMLIGGTEGFSRTGKFGSMEEGLRRLSAALPDVILCDIGLPGMNGVEGIKVLKQRFPELLVLMLTIYDDDERIFNALCAGACGYLLKKTPPVKLLESLREAVENWIDSTIASSDLHYEKLDILTSFGNTRILSVNHSNRKLSPIIYVPGARICGAFLDLSNQLKTLRDRHRIYLLDVVGQVGLSDGDCPSLKDASYGFWLEKICRKLEIEQAIFIGASFGGQIIMKFAAIAPQRIEKPS